MTRPTNSQLQQSIEQLPESLQLPAQRAWERICKHDGAEASVQHWSAETCDVFCRLLASSDYAAATSFKYWHWLENAIATGKFDRPPKISFVLPANKIDEVAVKQSLRKYRHRQMLHILWREYARSATLAESLTSLSEMADELLVVTRAVAVEMLSERYGQAIDATGRKISLVILAMGKLGGFELNLSSDIDVFFLYPEEGETSGPHKLSAYEYFTRVARRTISLLADLTEDGFVYRVDTRLRPFGDSGPSVVSFASLESYLLQHGRSWERYAYVKARIVGESLSGDIVTELMHNMIEPFVYRRYLDFGVFESLRDMHAMIAAEVQKCELAANIKRGPGGIREIEFIVQSLQLVRGGSNDNLRQHALEAALQELDRSRSLPADTIEELRSAYRFLRRLENFIQAIRDQQTHDLPGNELDRARLALAMQFDSWDALETALSGHRQRVSRRFREVAFREDGMAEHALADNSFSALWEAAADESRWSERLNAKGFSNPDLFARELVAFSCKVRTQQIDTAARKRLRQLIPELLNLLCRRQSPEIILRRVLNIVDRILRRSAYIALLNENRTAMRRLVDLCEHSAYLAEEIGRFPILLDEMLDPRLFTSTMSAGQMRADISERLQQVAGSDSERMVEVLGHYQRAALFRIAIADFSAKLPIMKVSDALTDLAEIILTRLLEIAWQDLVRKHGEPWFSVNGVRRRAGFGVIAYGKLGGMELSYGSDLDLVFLHDSTGTDQQTDGDKPLDNSVFFARLVRRLVHFLTTQTASGALYEVDTRLRPSGRSGLLVVNVEAFERYQIDNAWTWEHQALLRSRPVAGNVSVHREFERIRTDTLRYRVDRQNLADDVRSMRARMRQQLDKSSPELFDLKQAPGGIADLEFLVQYLVLKNANRDATVIHYRDNIRQLGTLAAAGCLACPEVQRLQETYRKYRARLHRLALDARPPLVADSEFRDERRRVIDLWRREVGGAEGV